MVILPAEYGYVVPITLK